MTAPDLAHAAPDLKAIQALAAPDMTAMDALIRRRLASDVVLVNQIAEYIVDAGGKRLRPMLLLLAARALGHAGPDAHQLAAVVEFIHTATLLHDDVVDESDLRRGRKTANAVWGNAASVLVGDFLYSRSFQLMVELERMDVQQLQHFAFGNRVGGVGQELHHLRPSEFDHQLEAARIQEVPDQHRRGITPHRIGGAAPAPQVGFIDHVVMEQGGGVDELDHRRKLVRIPPAMSERPCGQQQQHRAQALAAGTDDVFGDLVDQHHVRGQPPADQSVHRRHVRCGEGLDRFEVGEIGGAGHGAGSQSTGNYRGRGIFRPVGAGFAGGHEHAGAERRGG